MGSLGAGEEAPGRELALDHAAVFHFDSVGVCLR
jgi:hypothetical protein